MSGGMNGRETRQEPALAMICLSAKQEPPDQGRNTPPETHPPAEVPSRSSPTAIDARPLQSVPPKPHSNGNVVEEEKKREREHKKRSKNWTRIETTKLIRIRSDMEPRFCRAGRKSDLWDEISELLRTEGVCRDPQQCRDKWEKLTAAYKEVREGIRDKEDFPFFCDLDPILSGKPPRRESLPPHPPPQDDTASDDDTEDAAPRKKRRSQRPDGDRAVEVLKELMESAMAQQQRFMADLVEAMERRERFREKIRQEREERWREEDREQRLAFENAILVLAKRIGREEGREEEKEKEKEKEKKKKRSRNWKRGEVALLIKKRREMEGRFEKAARRGAVWDELAEAMSAEGVKRDGKQCREKWDKLMAELKEVSEGKRDRRESPYFGELSGCGIGSVSLDDPTAAVH